MCEFTREGFQDGCEELGVASLQDLKEALPRMRQELKGNGQKTISFPFFIKTNLANHGLTDDGLDGFSYTFKQY